MLIQPPEIIENADNSSPLKADKDMLELQKKDSTVAQTKVFESLRKRFILTTIGFWFLHFFSLICTANLQNQLNIWLEKEEGPASEWKDKHGTYLATLAVLLALNVLLLLFFLYFVWVALRPSSKKMAAVMVIFIVVYCVKIVSSILLIFVDGDLVKQFRFEIKQVKRDFADGENTLCLKNDYYKCRLIFTWSFFELEQYIDFSACLLVFIGMIFYTRKFANQKAKLSQ